MSQVNTQPTRLTSIATLPPCEQLKIVSDALFQIASGQKTIIVRHGDYWVEYQPGSVAFLERERARLTQLCGQAGGRFHAITIGRTRGGW